MLAGQYTEYLWRQIDKYVAKLRIHDESEPEDQLLSEFTREELRDLFAYLSEPASPPRAGASWPRPPTGARPRL
jgi:hypothetical protein